MSLLEVRGLGVSYSTPQGTAHAVDEVSFTIEAGETVGIVGESGSGKSQTALAIMGLLGREAVIQGSIRFEGKELVGLDGAALRAIRGAAIGIVFQDPMSSLNPYLSIGTQLAEVLVQHRRMSGAAAWVESAHMLDAVRIADAPRKLRQYPHELSGGMRQRVTIAMALLCRPALLVADEPTTALDVTVQAQILELLDDLREEFRMALLLITHDLGVVGESCDRALVMYAGRIVEAGSASSVLQAPLHPYTCALLASRPRLDQPRPTRLTAIEGVPPNVVNRPSGCTFAPRCANMMVQCKNSVPALKENMTSHSFSCHLPLGGQSERL